MADPIPRTIGRYEIEGVEAEGGMGVVYVARDPRVKRRVAVKLLKKLFCQDPNVRRRFEREAEAVAGLEHEAIVPVYDFGEHQGMLYIVMRYVGGGTLRDRINDAHHLSIRNVSGVIDRVSEALAAAHDRGIIHRDIKPANILFDEREVPYLSDFGVAKAAESNEQISNSQGSMVLGTPQYLSPEQAMGKPVDGRSDVYSLGIVAFHALCGRPPFEAPNPIAMAMAHVNKDPPKISSLIDGLPPATDGVFDQVLAKRPKDRYQSPVRFARDLRDIASGRWYLVKLSNRLGMGKGPPTRPEPVAKPPEDPASKRPPPAPASPHSQTVAYSPPEDIEQTFLDVDTQDTE